MLTLLFDALWIKSQNEFKKLSDSFWNSLNWDPDIFKMFKKIGFIYLGVNSGEKTDLMNIFEGFLK